MQDMNRSTNSNMAWLSFLSLAVCLSVAGLQLWHLKNYFERKKLLWSNSSGSSFFLFNDVILGEGVRLTRLMYWTVCHVDFVPIYVPGCWLQKLQHRLHVCLGCCLFWPALIGSWVQIAQVFCYFQWCMHRLALAQRLLFTHLAWWW